MRNRAGQALNAAMDLKLHAKGNEEGFYAEANRRVWWMTVGTRLIAKVLADDFQYIVACQGAILSNSAPPMLLYDPRFTTAHPTFAMDTEVSPVLFPSPSTSNAELVLVCFPPSTTGHYKRNTVRDRLGCDVEVKVKRISYVE